MPHVYYKSAWFCITNCWHSLPVSSTLVLRVVQQWIISMLLHLQLLWQCAFTVCVHVQHAVCQYIRPAHGVWWSHACPAIGSCAECNFGWRCGGGLCGWHGNSALGSIACWLFSRIFVSIGIQISLSMLSYLSLQWLYLCVSSIFIDVVYGIILFFYL